MSTITWLHLSDLHFRAEEQHTWDENIVLRKLLEDVAERIEQDGLRPDFVVVTGDIAYSGKPAEYDLARHFFNQLLRVTGLGKDRLFLVPGNHDVDLTRVSRGAQGIVSSLTDRDSANAILANPDDRRLMLAPLLAYGEFVTAYMDGYLRFDDEHYYYVRRLELAGIQTAILGLNSAWMTTSAQDETNKIVVGEYQVRKALDEAADTDLTIALLHQSLDSLRQFDRQDVEPLLCDGCDFILHGHTQQVSLLQTRTPDTGAVIITAGATYQMRRHPTLYNMVRLNVTAEKCTIYLRRYADARGGFWAKDTLTYRNAPDGEYTFDFTSVTTPPSFDTETETQLPDTTEPPPPQPSPPSLPQPPPLSWILLIILLVNLALVTYLGWCLVGNDPNLMAYLQVIVGVYALLAALMAYFFVARYTPTLRDVMYRLGTERKWRYMILALTSLLLVVTYLVCHHAPTTPAPTPTPLPKLTIDSHHSGDLVDLKEEVSGTYAGLGPNWRLWSIVHPAGSDYWVQRSFIVDEPNGEWTLEARFGYEGTRDISESFEFLVVAVEQGSDAEKLLESTQGRSIKELPTDKVYTPDSPLRLVRAAPTERWLGDFWDNDAWQGEPLTTTEEITSTFLFQEWWEPPFAGMPETGWTARFVRRIRFPADGAYCFYRVRDNEVELLIDGEPLGIPQDAPEWMYAESKCVDLEAGFHDIQVDLANTAGSRAVVELWYTGDGIKLPEDGTSGMWQATFHPTAALGKMPVWRTSFPGPALHYEWSSGDQSPVVSFAARFTSTLVVTETGRYRFDVEVDDGGQFYIDGEMVLDEFHGGPGNYVIERYLEVGNHTLRLDYYEYHGRQYAHITWTTVPEPVHPVQRILFVSNRDGDDEIYVMDSNGANPIQLTENSAWDHHPAWSPDGSRIVFASDREEAVGLYVMDADGGNVQPLNASGYEPRWSPDGSRIAFVSEEDGDPDIYVVDADGMNARNLTNNSDRDYAPDWSPDGLSLVFETDREGGDLEIYVMAADGSGQVNLSHHAEGWDGTPAWSPDGQRIAFSSYRYDNVDLYVMDADGENQQRVTTWELEDKFPDWSLDGRYLVFQGVDAKGGGGWGQIYYTVLGQDAGRVALTDSNGLHEVPQWSPLSQGFTFTSLTNGNFVTSGAITVTDDYVWTGGSGGLIRWNRRDPAVQTKYVSEHGLLGNNVRDVKADLNDSLWIALGTWPFYDGGWSHYVYTDGRDHWRAYTPGEGVEADRVTDFFRDSQGQIWAGAMDGVWIYDGKNWEVLEELKDEWVTIVYEAPDGVFWFKIVGSAVVRYDPEANQEDAWQRFDYLAWLDPTREGYKYASAIVQDASGRIWLGTNGGAVSYDGETWRAAESPLNTWITSALRARDDRVWFGVDAYEYDLVRLDPDGQVRTYSSKDGLRGVVQALAQHSDGDLWAAGDGLYLYDPQLDRFERYHTSDQQANNLVGAILQDHTGALWFGHSVFYSDARFANGVSRYVPGQDDEWQHLGTQNGLTSNAVHTMAEDDDGVLWFGFGEVGGGACRYDLAIGELVGCYPADPHGLITDTVDSILHASDGAMWFGTNGGGINRFRPGQWEHFTQENTDNQLLSDQVHCLQEDGEGDIWIATDQGINCFSYDDGNWWSFTTKNSDLIDDNVLAIAPDGDKGIWFGTKTGLAYLDLASRNFEAMGETPSLPGWVRGCAQLLQVDRYGTLWVGTDDGLYRRTLEGKWLHFTTINGLASKHILAVFEDADGVLWIGTPSGVTRLEAKR